MATPELYFVEALDEATFGWRAIDATTYPTADEAAAAGRAWEAANPGRGWRITAITTR